MTEFKINIGLPGTDIGYENLAKKADKFFSDGLNILKQEFVESCSSHELEILFIAQDIKYSNILTLISRELDKRYKNDFLTGDEEFKRIRDFLLTPSYYTSDKDGRLANFRQKALCEHLQTKTIGDLAILYSNLFGEDEFDKTPDLITKVMIPIINEKLDEKTSIGTLVTMLSANFENSELEKIVQERFGIACVQ